MRLLDLSPLRMPLVPRVETCLCTATRTAHVAADVGCLLDGQRASFALPRVRLVGDN
jgi:hypothetical protein